MRRPDWLPFRRFALGTTVGTGLLMMLGVYTAATGSGLACAQQWPLCDGGLLPQTVPSFIEWSHRLVAMVVGFLIAGTAAWSWRTDVDGRATLGATAALVLLPLQVSIGAVTVTLDGALPQGYSTPTQAAHLLAALSIFTALALATLFAYRGNFDRPRARRVRLALLATLLVLPANTLLGRATPLVPYSPAAQALFVGTGLVAFGALLAATRWATDSRVAAGSGVALVGVFVVLLLGRDLVFYGWTVHLLNWLVVGVTVAATALAAWAAGAGETVSSATTAGD